MKNCLLNSRSHFPNLNNLLKDERGTSFVEAAVLLPIIVTLILAIIQWALIMSGEMTLKNASVVTARAMILGTTTPTDAVIEQLARDTVTPALDPANLIVTTNSAYSSGSLTAARLVQLDYDMPVFFPVVVPGSTGGIYRISSTAVMK